jgi:hypothetical protein
MEQAVFTWVIVVLATLALLLATWFGAEWACRRIAERYEGRKRLFTGLAPNDNPDEA